MSPATRTSSTRTRQTAARSVRRRRRKAGRLVRSKHSMSLFLVHFGVEGQYADLAHHTILFGPRYKELLTDIFDHGILADDFSLYLHSPSVTDDSMAPAGTLDALRAGAGTEPRTRQSRLGNGRAAAARPHPGFAGTALHAGITSKNRDLAALHAAGFRTRTECLAGRRILAAAHADTERVVPGAQPGQANGFAACILSVRARIRARASRVS